MTKKAGRTREKAESPRPADVIVPKLWALCSALRDDGISYHEYLTELSLLLFLKLAADRAVTDLPDRDEWTSLLKSDRPLARYEQLLTDLGEDENPQTRAIFSGASTRIRREEALRVILVGLDDIDWTEGDNTVGDVYEGLLARNAQEARLGAGQYFTPRPLIDVIVRCLSPSADDVVYDPAAGTSGFLVAAGTHGVGANRSQPRLVGVELVQEAHRMGLMNLALHHLEGDLHHADALEVGARAEATLVLTNPPFGTRSSSSASTWQDLRFPTSNKQLAFLQHVADSLAPDGRAAVVVPDNVLFEGGVAAHVREYLFTNFDVHTVLQLPPGIFYATGVRTSVLFFNRSSPRRDTWFFDARSGAPSFGRRRPLTTADFEPFVRSFGRDPSGRGRRTASERFFRVPQREISVSGYRLDRSPPAAGSRNVPTEEPLVTLSSIRAELEVASDIVGQLERLFGDSTSDE